MICTLCHQPIEDAKKIETPEGSQHFKCFCGNQSPEKPGYFPPYDDQGNRRTIKNAVDCGWQYDSKS